MRENEDRLPESVFVEVRLDQRAHAHLLPKIPHLARLNLLQYVIFVIPVGSDQLRTDGLVVLLVQIQFKLRLFRNVERLIEALRRHPERLS